jgi:ornithine--oxo-acid transaminase
MIENAARQGAYFKAQLEGIQSDVVREVRGRGLMLAIELHAEAGGARRYCEALRDRGMLAKDTHDNTIRISPPLVITREQVDGACDTLAQVLTAG